MKMKFNIIINMAGRTREGALLLVACAALVVAYALAVPPALDGLDAVNFARGLTDYDLARFQPHFPGYPVYMLLARGFSAAGVSDVWALALPGVLGVPAGLAVLFLGLRRLWGGQVAILAAAAVGLAPIVATVAARPGSDGLGLAVALAAMGAVAGGRERLAGALIGLIPGVRLSYLPIAAVLAAVRPSKRRVGMMVLASMAWAVPFAVVAGADLIALASDFVHGHLFRWGGTALASGGSVALGLDRLTSFGAAVLVGGLGGGIAAGAVALGLAFGGRRARTMALLAAPYALWVFVVQDADDPRHSAPLVAALLIAAAAGWARTEGRWGRGPGRAAAAVGLIGLVLAAAPAIEAQRLQPSPALQVARWVESRVPAAGTEYAGGGEVRLLNHRAPRFRARRQRDLAAVRADLGSPRRRPRLVLVSSAVVGTEQAAAEGLEELARFRGSPSIHRDLGEVTIYRMRWP